MAKAAMTTILFNMTCVTRVGDARGSVAMTAVGAVARLMSSAVEVEMKDRARKCQSVSKRNPEAPPKRAAAAPRFKLCRPCPVSAKCKLHIASRYIILTNLFDYADQSTSNRSKRKKPLILLPRSMAMELTPVSCDSLTSAAPIRR